MNRLMIGVFLCVPLILNALPKLALAGQEPYIGEIMMTGANFCPRGWSDANGQLLAVSQHTALYSLFGTTYGGDGRTTFALPDLRGRVPIHTGQGPGLTNRNQGSKSGSEKHQLTLAEMPQHTHGLMGTNNLATTRTPAGNVPAKTRRNAYGSGAGPLSPMAAASVGPAGNTLPHNNMQPFLTIRFCVALQGIYPSRN